jgi:hypothetical protein
VEKKRGIDMEVFLEYNTLVRLLDGAKSLKEGTKNEEISHLSGSGFGYADALCLRRRRA